MTNDDYFLYLTILGLLPYYQKSGPGGGTNLPSILEGLGEDGTAAKSSEPGGWGKMSNEMSEALSAASLGKTMAQWGMGLAGVAAPAALGPLGYGMMAMSVANKAADPFEANPLGPYGMGAMNEAEAARAAEAYGMMDPVTQADYMTGITAKANNPTQALLGSFVESPYSPRSLAEVERSLGISSPATPGAAWDAMGRPAYGMGEPPSPMTGFTSMPDFAVNAPPGSPNDPSPPGAKGPGDTEDTDIGNAAAANDAAANATNNDPNAGAPGGPGGPGPDDNDPNQGSGGGAGAGSDSDSNEGGGAGGGGGSEGDRLGGVHRTTKQKTTNWTWGEPGTAGPGKSGETAIFIPDFMKAPGIQGRERAVARALREYLNILAPVGR
jgi:hypothetical protein